MDKKLQEAHIKPNPSFQDWGLEIEGSERPMRGVARESELI